MHMTNKTLVWGKQSLELVSTGIFHRSLSVTFLAIENNNNAITAVYTVSQSKYVFSMTSKQHLVACRSGFLQQTGKT